MRQVYVQKSQCDHWARQTQAQTQARTDADHVQSCHRFATFLDSVSSRDESIRSEVFADLVKDTMVKKGGESHAGRNPGFYRYENRIRDVNLEAVLTRDYQSIPASQKLRTYVLVLSRTLDCAQGRMRTYMGSAMPLSKGSLRC